MTVPPAVPALPDTQRIVSYSISSSAGPFAVTFAIYGDGADVTNWIEVWLNDVQTAFTLTSPTGPITSIPRPITDAQITLPGPATGTLVILGARRPRRLTQFTENSGVAARDFNQAITDIVADMREAWDFARTRQMYFPGGETVSNNELPIATARANKVLLFDSSGNPSLQAVTISGSVGAFTLTVPRAHFSLVTMPTNTVMLSGFATEGDAGSGAIYTSVGASSSSPMAIQDASGTWFGLVINGPINVCWFGAVGDSNGTTGNGTDNTAAFQAVIDFSNASFFRTGMVYQLYVPTGKYRIAAPLIIGNTGRGNIHWVGDGKDSSFYYRSVLYFDHTSSYCISINEASGVFLASFTAFRDIGFLANSSAGVLQHCFQVNGAQLNNATIRDVSFSGFTGYCFWFATNAAYMQCNTFADIYLSQVGGFISNDKVNAPFAGGNVIKFSNIDLENGINASVARQHAFFDFQNFSDVQMHDVIFEGGASTNVIFRIGPDYFYLNGFYTEQNSTPYFDNMVEIVAGGSSALSQATIKNATFENATNDKLIYFNGVSNSRVYLENLGTAFSSPALSDDINWGTGHNNKVTIFNNSRRIVLDSNLISNFKLTDLSVVASGSDPRARLYVSTREKPLIDLRGAWLDGVSGSAAIVLSAAVSGSIASIGIYNDATEGRVFEVVSAANQIPYFNFTLTPPAELINNQLVATLRYYVSTTVAGLQVQPFLPNFHLAPNYYQGTGLQSGVTNDMVANTWTNGYVVMRPQDTTAFSAGATLYSGSPAASGTTKIRIAAIYISLGTEIPFLVGGGNLATPISWMASAAPTYGNYIVGDQVINSVPTVAQPKGWICTVAGSPGTWVSLGNL